MFLLLLLNDGCCNIRPFTYVFDRYDNVRLIIKSVVVTLTAINVIKNVFLWSSLVEYLTFHNFSLS